ncbi:MAG: hypothetical protein P4L53_20815 [Candidatus Obscuribacterales bacterium]|nr:hypothetical protein [Candidatus Obscuribacterales bacterium]
MPALAKSNGRSKALVATAFAVSVLSLNKVVAADSEVQAISATQQIVKYKDDIPFTKAYQLLSLANSYLVNNDSRFAERCVIGDSYKPMKGWTPSDSGRSNVIAWLSNGIALRQSGIEASKHQQSINQTLADDTLIQAIKQIEIIPEPARRLKLYFIASMLFKEAGDSTRYEQCKKIIDENIVACHDRPRADEDQIRAAVFVLNSRAYSILPFAVGDLQERVVHARIGQKYDPVHEDFNGPVTQQSFKSAEKLRLKGLAMADLLSAGSDVRRRAHRDMVIWYRGLGKAELAEKEKQTLFELVGFKDDGLLYPRSGTCGSEIWWQPKIVNIVEAFCGMG